MYSVVCESADSQRHARSRNVVKCLGYCMKQMDFIFLCVGQYCDNAEKTLKRGKNNSHATRLLLVAYFFVVITFDVICTLLESKTQQNGLTILWNKNGRSN